MKFLILLALPCFISAEEYWADCFEGEVVFDEEDSHRYYECERGRWLQHTCEHDLLYNSFYQKCDKLRGAYVQCMEEREVPNHKDLRKFFKCQKGSWTQMDCGEGFLYNSVTKQCQETRAPAVCPEGRIYPDLYDSRHFYQCHHGAVVRRACGPNLVYESTSRSCA